MESKTAQQAADFIRQIERANEVISLLQQQEQGLFVGSVTTAARWKFPDTLRGELIRHFRKQLEFYQKQLEDL